MCRCLVTGARGFIGSHLAHALRARGHSVIGTSRRAPAIDRRVDVASDDDVSWFTTPLIAAAPSELDELLRNVDVVFHVAAHVAVTGRGRAFVEGNIHLTKILLDACERVKVPYFIHTSSPSVIADGTHLRGVDERYPYPSSFKGDYQRTKCLSERLTRQRGKEGVMQTLVLRPHLVFGPHDTSLTEGILEKARKRKLLRVGEGENLCDFTYIDDCVEAHIGAWEALQDNPRLSGNVYFISQGDPYPFWRWVDDIVTIHGLNTKLSVLPKVLSPFIGRCGDVAERCGMSPRVNSFLLSELLTDHYFSIEAAKRDLHFKPRWSVREAIAQYREAVLAGANPP
jgi:2-alkyl-3-oxoalkanoate reductase